MSANRIEVTLPGVVAHSEQSRVWRYSEVDLATIAKVAQGQGWQIAIAPVRPASRSAGHGMRQVRPVQESLARALGMREPAERNLDAFADQLVDLPQMWPGCQSLMAIVDLRGTSAETASSSPSQPSDMLDSHKSSSFSAIPSALLRIMSRASDRLDRLDGFSLETVVIGYEANQ